MVILAMTFLIPSKVFCWTPVHFNFFLTIPTRSVSGAKMWLFLFHISLKNWTIPKKLFSCYKVGSWGLQVRYSLYLLLYWYYTIFGEHVSFVLNHRCKNDDFSTFTLSPALLSLCKTICSWCKWSSKVQLLIISKSSI